MLQKYVRRKGKLVFAGVVIGFLLSTWFQLARIHIEQSAIKHGRRPPNGPNEAAKKLVFIGVVTAEKFLATRAKSIYDTWGRRIPGQMAFFSSYNSSSTNNIPVINLHGVDDVYPPQKKSFMMLKYMHDNYLDEFEWFMRIDDDLYVNPDKLEVFLRSLNSSKMHYIGQPGLGKPEELGKLGLEENFCMG
jgi:chondroitin sulfate synthase